jgi:hypothetical protein
VAGHRAKLHMTGKPVMGELVTCVPPGGLILDRFAFYRNYLDNLDHRGSKMSYDLAVLLPPVPADDESAWDHLSQIQDRMDEEKGGADVPLFLQLAERLTARYPDLTKCGPYDESPWSDGPMTGNVLPELFYFGLSFTKASVVVPFVVQEANSLGLTVFDVQTEEIFRP